MPSAEANMAAYLRRFEPGAVKGVVLSPSISSAPSIPPRNEYEAPFAGLFNEPFNVGELERDGRGGVGGRKVEGGGEGVKTSDESSFVNFSRH